MTKILAAALAGIPTYAVLGALHFGMADSNAGAVTTIAQAPLSTNATASRVIELQRVVVVGKRLGSDVLVAKH